MSEPVITDRATDLEAAFGSAEMQVELRIPPEAPVLDVTVRAFRGR